MITFLTAFALFGALLLVATVPLIAVHRSPKYRNVRFRSYLISGVVVTLFCAAVATSSKTLMGQCVAARNENCIDAGGSGLQLLLAGGYAAFVLGNAYLIYKD